MKTISVLAAAVGATILSGAAMADSFHTYGETSVVGGSFQLVSDTSGSPHVGWAGLYDTISVPGSLTPATLTQLSADYQMTQGTFSNGAPRFSLEDYAGNEAWVYWGTPLGGGSFSDPASGSPGSTGNYADLSSTDVRVYVNGFGGINQANTGVTWSAFVAEAAATPIHYVSLDLDGGGGLGGAQKLLVNNFNVNGAVDNPAAPVPLPAAAWMGMSLIGGLGGARGIKNRLRRQKP